MDNSEKLATLDTQDEDKKNQKYKTNTKNTTQKTKKMSNTVPTGVNPDARIKNYIFVFKYYATIKRECHQSV